MSTGAAGSLSATLDSASRDIRRILAGVLDGHELSVDDGIALTGAAGRDLHAITLFADEMRRRQVGDVVTYVVNRNINFTNVCIKHCGFCAFSRDHREEEGYLLPVDEVVRRAREAWELGATEVCIQAGLPPKLDGHYYIDLTRAIKRALPGIHMHAFSPEEVLYGSVRSGLPIKEYLAELKAAGLGTLPGTSAEILDQEIRDRISRGRITVDQWVEVVPTAHTLVRRRRAVRAARRACRAPAPRPRRGADPRAARHALRNRTDLQGRRRPRIAARPDRRRGGALRLVPSLDRVGRVPLHTQVAVRGALWY